MRMLRNGASVLAGLLLLSSSPATARNWPDAGGFEIHESDEFCFLSAEYKGPGDSLLSLALFRDGKVIVGVSNYNWSAKKDEKYEGVSLDLDGTSYGGATALGYENDGRMGFMVSMESDFVPHFTSSTYLHVYKDKQLIDRLDLAGSTVAVAAVKRCLAYVDGLRRAEERERKRYEDLPKDPFAPKQK
jgi:protein TonB